MEGATKWDPGHLKLSREVNHSNGLVKHCDSRHTANTSVVPALQVELIRARNCFGKLEAERERLRKKFKRFVGKLNEERISWMRGERHKMHVVIDSLKDDLRRERRVCKRLDVVNSKLLVRLADSKLFSKQYKQDYEKEGKSRESLEGVLDKLVKEIEEDKAEIEALKCENARHGEEVEEERKKLQLAEVYREEQAQMKLINAKLIFEEKYCLMSKLISELESFLRSNNVTVDMTDLSEVQVDVTDYSTRSHSPAIQIVGTESKACAPSTSSECLNRFLDHDESCKDESGEMEGSANTIDRGRYLLSDKVNHEKNTGKSGSLDFETSEISSVFPKQSKKKGSSFRKFWRSSLSSDEFHKTLSLDESGRVPNASARNVGIISSKSEPAERTLAYQGFVIHCCSGDPRNPHVTRAMNGCIEWPRRIPKYGLKSKLSEGKIRKPKIKIMQYT